MIGNIVGSAQSWTHSCTIWPFPLPNLVPQNASPQCCSTPCSGAISLAGTWLGKSRRRTTNAHPNRSSLHLPLSPHIPRSPKGQTHHHRLSIVPSASERPDDFCNCIMHACNMKMQSERGAPDAGIGSIYKGVSSDLLREEDARE